MNMLKKSDLPVVPQFFDRYINIAEDNELIDSLQNSYQKIEEVSIATLELLKDNVYAPGKWTVKDILQHMIDTERIQAYRALRIARNDKNELIGFDEELFAQNTIANQRTVKDLIEEYKFVRLSSIALFKNMTDEMLLRTGTAFKVQVTALSLGFVLVGHQKHHFNIINEKYLPLLS
jgi:hypothetical protein